MPRPKNNSSTPSAASRFIRQRGGQEGDSQLQLGDVTDASKLFALVDDVIATGASVSFNLTSDRRSLAITFYVHPDRVVWYIQRVEDWQELIEVISL